GALESLGELVPLDPNDEAARKKLLDVGRRANAHARVAEVLGSAADAATDVGVQGEILLDQASVYENLLTDDVQAERVYRRILVLSGAATAIVVPALRSLERIYDARSQYKELVEI